MTDDHKKQVQNNIQHSGKTKIIQRLLRIPHCAVHRITKVVNGQRRHSQIIDPQVQYCFVQKFLSGLQHCQHPLG